MSLASSFYSSNNLSSAPNVNANKDNIKMNIENYIGIIIPKYFEGREFSIKMNKWQQEFLDDLENYCTIRYSNYKFYFWCAVYERKGGAFNSSDRVNFYSETDIKISLFKESTNVWIDIGGIGIKNLNLTHKGSINDFKSELRNKIESIIKITFEDRIITPGDNGGKFLNYILDEILQYVKSKDDFLYYYLVGTIFKKGMNHFIIERYFNQTSNFGSVYLNYENDSVKCNVHVFSCI